MKEHWDLSVPLGRVVVASLCPMSPCEPGSALFCPRPVLLSGALGVMGRTVVLGQALGNNWGLWLRCLGVGGSREGHEELRGPCFQLGCPLMPASSEERFGLSKNPRCSRLLMMLVLLS